MDTIPIKDPELFKAWLKENPHYTDWDIAYHTGESIERVIHLRQRLGVMRRRTPNVTKRPRQRAQLLLPPPPNNDWRHVEWFKNAYANYSMSQIANVAGVTAGEIKDYAFELRLPYRNIMHPFNRRDWLYEHYVRQNLTTQEIAKKAQVTRYIIRGWMAKHGIAPRHNVYDGIPVWWRKLAMTIKGLKFTRYNMRKSGAISVSYRSGKRDIYTFNPNHKVDNLTSFLLTESDIRCDKIPKVYSSRLGHVYDSVRNPLDFYVSPKDLRNASFLERRVLYHTLASIIASNGFTPLNFTDEEIINDMPDFGAMNHEDYFNNFAIKLRPKDTYKLPNGFRFMLSFFEPTRAFRRCLFRPDYLIRSMTRLEKTSTRPLSLMTLAMSMAALYKSPFFHYAMPTPKMYYALFQRLKIKGPILDLFPGMGAKYLAAHALGIDYYTMSAKAIAYAEKQGIENVLGTNMKLYDGRKVEWIIYDNDMSIRERELPTKLLQNAEHLLHFDKGGIGRDTSYSFKIPVYWNKYTGSTIYFAVD